MPDMLDLSAARARLDSFAAHTGTEAPTALLAPDGLPAPDCLAYCLREGLPLEWLFYGDARRLLDAYRQTH